MLQENKPILRTHPPLFIVGCGRSGTTMLRLMLDTHPEIAVPNESQFITELWAVRHRYIKRGVLDPLRLADDIMRTRHFRLWKIPEEAVRKQVRALTLPNFTDIIDTVFSSYAKHHGKIRWGDKTPKYVKFMDLLARLFPDARFVHLIRDGRNVAVSYLSVPWGPSNIWEAAWKWRRAVRAGRISGQRLGPKRYMELRYEHLVAQPRDALKQMCDFSELRYVEDLLEFHRSGEERLQWPDGMRFHASSTRPPAVGVRDWRFDMNDEDQQAFEALAGDLLSELGYERRFPSVPLSKIISAKLQCSSLNISIIGRRIKRSFLRRFTKRPIAGMQA